MYHQVSIQFLLITLSASDLLLLCFQFRLSTSWRHRYSRSISGDKWTPVW